jgi:hypothetical protein
MELQEELSAEFEEACDHVGRREEWKGLTFSPVVPVPMADLAAGAFGWRREARIPGHAKPSTLALVLHPKGSAHALPLTGAKRENFAYVHDFSGDPPAALLATAPAGGKDDRLKQLATAIAHELDDE